jgi:hypothetical protein
MINLYQAIDSVKNRFGEDVLLRGGGAPPKSSPPGRTLRSGLDEKMPVGRIRKKIFTVTNKQDAQKNHASIQPK